MSTELDISRKIQAASIADPVAAAASLAVAALSHQQQEQIFATLKAKFKIATFQGSQDDVVTELARQRLLTYEDQAELIYNDLRINVK